jgi:hypothetical protein
MAGIPVESAKVFYYAAIVFMTGFDVRIHHMFVPKEFYRVSGIERLVLSKEAQDLSSRETYEIAIRDHCDGPDRNIETMLLLSCIFSPSMIWNVQHTSSVSWSSAKRKSISYVFSASWQCSPVRYHIRLRCVAGVWLEACGLRRVA